MTLFEVAGELPGELVVVGERDDGRPCSTLRRAAWGPRRRPAVGDVGRDPAPPHASRRADSVVTGSALVNALRRTKSPEEIAVMERACEVADATMRAVAPTVRHGVTMLDLVEEVEHLMRSTARECLRSRRTSSPGSARERARRTPRTAPAEEGDVVMFDFGAVVDGYCSDFGRTVCVGEPGPRFARHTSSCWRRRRPVGPRLAGVPANEVNRACRRPIEEAGYGASFKHRMGHGIGLDVHEPPFVSEEDETLLEAGMTFTDEPSILADGRFGVRIEDVVVCEAEGGRSSTASRPTSSSTCLSGGGRPATAAPVRTRGLPRRLRQADVDRVEALKTAPRRSLVAAKTCVGWINGKYGPDWFSRRWIAP